MFCFPHPTEEWTGLLRIYLLFISYSNTYTDLLKYYIEMYFSQFSKSVVELCLIGEPQV